mgnify:CR=1 FL=1
MLLSGCKGNTFFWKSTFFYGLICVQSEKTQKTTWFISQQTDLIEEQKQRKQAYFVAKRNRIVGFFTQNTLKGYKYWIFFKFLAFITGKLCIFASTNQVLRIWLNKQKETFLWVQRDVSFSFRRLLFELKEAASRRLPLGSADLLSLVSSSADCSQQVCRA